MEEFNNNNQKKRKRKRNRKEAVDNSKKIKDKNNRLCLNNQVNFASSFSETRNVSAACSGIKSERYLLGNCDNYVGNNCFIQRVSSSNNAKLITQNPHVVVHNIIDDDKINDDDDDDDDGVKKQTYVLGDCDNKGNCYIKKMEQDSSILKVPNRKRRYKQVPVVSPYFFNNLRGESQAAKFESPRVREKQKEDQNNKEDGKRALPVPDKITVLMHKAQMDKMSCSGMIGNGVSDCKVEEIEQTEGTNNVKFSSKSPRDGVEYQMDGCDNGVGKYEKKIKKRQFDGVENLSVCSNIESEKRLSKLHEMLAQFAYTGGAYGNTERRLKGGCIENDDNANCSKSSQILQPCSQTNNLEDKICHETESFRKLKTCSSSVSSKDYFCSCRIKFSDNLAAPSFSQVSDKMEDGKKIHRVAGTGSSKKQGSTSRVRERRSKEVRVVSPYFLNQTGESLALKVPKFERIVRNGVPLPSKGHSEMQTNVPEGKTNSAIQIGQNNGDRKREVAEKTTVLVQKGQTEKRSYGTIRNEVHDCVVKNESINNAKFTQATSTEKSVQEGVKFQIDNCDNGVDKYEKIMEYQRDGGENVSDYSNMVSEKRINKLHEMFAQFTYTGGAHGNVTNSSRWGSGHGKRSEASQILQSYKLEEKGCHEAESFRKCEACSASVSSKEGVCSSCIKLSDNLAPASCSQVIDKMEDRKRIDRGTGAVSSKKQGNISKGRKKRSKEFRVVPPYFLNQSLKSQDLAVAKSERIVQVKGPFPIPEGGEMQANMPESKTISDVQVGEDLKERKRDVPEKPMVLEQKGQTDKTNCGTIRNGVRIISRFFAASESSKEKTDKRPLKSKSAIQRKTLTAAQKRDEAYKKRTTDNMWKPPRSPFHLLQEDHSYDPWRVLVICILLNVTTGRQVREVLQEFFALCPNAKVATEVAVEDIEKVTKSLGLSKKRSMMVQRFSQEYLEDTWTYVTQLYGIGKYAADAYAAFTNGKWDRIVPTDHMLNHYWDFLRSLENGHHL